MGVSKLLGSLLLAYSLLQPNLSNALCDTKSYLSRKDYTLHGRKGPVAILEEEIKINCEYPPYTKGMLIDYGMDDTFDCLSDEGYNSNGEILNKGNTDFAEFVCTDNGQLIDEDNTVVFTTKDFISEKTNFLNEYGEKIINATKDREVVQLSPSDSDDIIYIDDDKKSNFTITKNKKSNDISLLLYNDGINYTLNRKGNKYSFEAVTVIKEKTVTGYKYSHKYIISMEEENTSSSKIFLDKVIETILSNLDIEKTKNNLDRIYKEEYCDTLVLYANKEVYKKSSKVFETIKNGKENYSKLGISFIYFSDKEGEDGEKYGGLFKSKYNTILIFKSNLSDTRSLYHEFGHSIYKIFFKSNKKMLDQWINLYNDLKSKRTLSSNYAYTNANEGFAEEYAYYKLNKNPEQPQILKEGFEFIDELLQGGCEK